MPGHAWRAAFAVDEHRGRVERVRQWMKESQVDLLVIHAPEHYNYLGGVDNTGVFYYQVLFVPQASDKDPIFLANRGDYNLALESSWIDDIRLYWNYENKYDRTLEIIRELFGSDDLTITIGMNLGSHYLKVEDYQALMDRLPNARIVNCHRALDDIRLVKSEKEIEYLRYSSFLSDLGFMAGLNAVAPGVMDREVIAAIEHTLFVNGAEWRSYPTLIGGTGRSPDGTGPKGVLHGTQVGRRLKEGNILYLEVSGNYKRYNCNISRMISIGEPSDLYKKAHQLVRDNLLRGQEAMASGVSTRKIYEIANTYPPEFQKYARASIGFSNELAYPPIWIGSLRFDRFDEHVLEPGMVVCLEPGFAYYDGMIMELGNMILITDDGHEVLNNTPLDFFVR